MRFFVLPEKGGESMAFFRKKEKPKQQIDFDRIDICDLAEGRELTMRVLAYQTCVNLIANAVSKCDFRTFRNHQPIKEAEWYLLNVEPNPNQNSSEFFNKLISNLYTNGEALVVDNGSRSKHEYLAVADSFNLDKQLSFAEQKYVGVVLNGQQMTKTYRESEVLHFKLNNVNIAPIINGIMQSYEKLLNAAEANYIFVNGVRLKDKVDMIANENEQADWQTQYMTMINKLVKPFLTSSMAVLPEFDGHEFSVMDFGGRSSDSKAAKEIANDIFEFTARALNIPPVLILGNVAGIDDTIRWFLTVCIDPLLDMLQEEINRKRYGYEAVRDGNYVQIDSSTIMHLDIFGNAANVEKLIGSGFLTIDQTRELAGLPPTGDEIGSKYFVTKNFADVATLGGGEQ